MSLNIISIYMFKPKWGDYMKKLFKFSSIVVALLATTISGCSNLTEQSNTESETKNVKIPQLLWWQIGPTPLEKDAVIEAMNEYSSEKIGVKIDIKYANWGEWEIKFPTIILSGEKFDIMFTDYTYYSAPIHLNAFADITDIVNNNVPELRSFIPDILWQGVKVNGKIYSVPTYKDSSQMQYWVWDKDLTDELNIDYKNVHTYADLDPVLRKIKAAKPQSYPLSIDQLGVQGLLDEYEPIAGFSVVGVSFYDDTATVVNVLNQPDIQEKLNYVRTWYKDGLVNPDSATLPALPKYKMVYSQQGFEGADTIWSTQDEYNVVSSRMWGPVYSTKSIQGSMNVVSSSSKYIEEAVKYLELVNTDPVMRNMFAYGIEGIHYKKTNENTIEFLNENYKPVLYSQGTFFQLMPIVPNPPNQWELVKAQNESASTSPILGFTFEQNNVKEELTNCKAVYDKYRSELLTGMREPLEVIEQMNAELYASGLQNIIDEAQLQIDKFLGK